MSHPHVELKDQLGRPLQDLRLSVTDRCNFRCVYCMPKEVFGPGYHFLPESELLTFAEIELLVRAFVDLGVRKVRLTGGEPLLRRDLYQLVERLSSIQGLEDLTMTSNGALLPRQAEQLKRAGLDRISVSLDALDSQVFRQMNDVKVGSSQVLAGIEAAVAAGLTPVKINMVVKRAVNEDQILPMAEHFRYSGQVLRFIEYMDVGTTNGWRLDEVVSAAEIVERIDAVYPLEPISPNYTGEVASRYRYSDGAGEIGVIASVSQPFCGDCSRVRVSADGKVFTCLFATGGQDLRASLRQGATIEEVRHRLEEIWLARSDRYSEERAELTEPRQKVEMYFIGG
jgi:cyclic pyranopterin phosphate synthase